MNKKNIIQIPILILLLQLYFNINTQYSPFVSLFSIIICVFQFIFVLKSGFTHYFRPVFIFLLSFFIVNCQLYIDLLLNIITPSHYGFVNSNTINKGVILSAIAFTSFAIGYNILKSKEYIFKNDILYSRNLYNVIRFFQISSFLLWVSQLSIDDFTGVSYLNSGAYDVTDTKYTDVLFSMSQIISYSYLSKQFHKPIKKIRIHKVIPFPFWSTSLFYILVKLMSGDRGSAIFICFMLLFFIIFITKIKIRIKIIFPVIVASAFIMTSISFARLLGNQLTFTEKLIYLYDNPDLLDEKPSIFPPTRELANSNLSTHVALDQIINHNEDFHYGEFHMCYILNCIPFISNTIIKELGIIRENRLSSEFVTVKFYGKFYQSGIGTSTIADNYLEFGVWGVILGVLILGILFKIIDNTIINSYGANLPMIFIIFSLTICYASISIPRAYFFFFIRLFIYIYILYKIFELLCYKKSRRVEN